MKVFIYSLNCPFTNQVKYVGKTKNTLVNRLSAHLCYSDTNIEKRLWIKSLVEKNTKPTINLLEITDEANWQKRECHWIANFISKGIVLLNKVQDLTQKEKALLMYRKELIRLEYRQNTQKVYISCFEKFLHDFDGFKYPQIKHDEIVQYLEYLVIHKKISRQYQNTIINAIKFYFEKVLRAERQTYYISRPRKQHKIRPILSYQQVEMLMNSIANLKQKTIMQVMYSGALRTGEVVSLLTGDLNRENGTYFIRDAKGAKDRHITLPQQTINLIDEYIKIYNPTQYLFAGQKPGNHYSSKSVQIKFEEKIKQLGFDLELTPHRLRHSRISHVLNNGVKLEMASKHAGHSNVNITSKTYHHYNHDEMREQFDNADKKILDKMSQYKRLPIPVLHQHLPILSILEKTYKILFNGKTYILKEENNKIIDAPEGAKWSIGVLSEKALGWFQRKGATINNI